MTNLTPVLQAASDVLNEMPGKQGHVREIAQCAAERNLTFTLSVDEFTTKLMNALAAHVKSKDPKFTKVVSKKDENGKAKAYKKGIYRLKRVMHPKAEEVHTPPTVGTAFLGKAGEHAVMSELLFWGFNASLMAVDQGIDIVASKDGKYFHLQVKATVPRLDGRYSFSVTSSAFNANDKSDTYYVLLMRTGNSNVFVVLPSNHLATQRNVGVIKSSESSLSFTIASDEKGKIYTLNGKDNVTPFINNFGQIR